VTGPKLVLTSPVCMFCRDKIATVETVAWGCHADLCPVCADQYADRGQPRRELRAGPAEPPLITEAEVVAYVEAQQWRRARPMLRGRPQLPHEYVLIWKSTDPWRQLQVLSYIRANGPRIRGYHRCTWGDFEYWSLAPDQTILNRRHLDWPTTA
jgi:hypothetical protein